ncbi:hypothetical protein MEO_02340, partial [Candida albicans P94015]
MKKTKITLIVSVDYSAFLLFLFFFF